LAGFLGWCPWLAMLKRHRSDIIGSLQYANNFLFFKKMYKSIISWIIVISPSPLIVEGGELSWGGTPMQLVECRRSSGVDVSTAGCSSSFKLEDDIWVIMIIVLQITR
jgi:hypothetical protein